MNNPPLYKLKRIRKSLGFSTLAMAHELNISKSMYIYIENGKRRLSYDLAIEIAEFFRMKPDELFIEDNRKFFLSSRI